MARSISTIRTDHASRYLQQLCKHWSHRFEVEFNEAEGKVPFSPDSSLGLTANPTSLVLTLRVDKSEDLERMQAVVADHLKRFAFREELDMAWTADASGV